MFRALGLWDAMAPDAQPINDIVVSDGELGRKPSPFSLHFDHREIGEVLGYIVENRHIRRGMLQAAQSYPGITFLPGIAVDALEVVDGSTAMSLSDGRTIESPLAVAAEGREIPAPRGPGDPLGQLGLSADRGLS
jgi:2-octaprenyl-6-methoxyphenol hydroxylase